VVLRCGMRAMEGLGYGQSLCATSELGNRNGRYSPESTVGSYTYGTEYCGRHYCLLYRTMVPSKRVLYLVAVSR